VNPDDDLRRDPIMARLIDDYGGPLPLEPDSRGRPEDHYGALVRSIAGQQLSVKAARSIWNRLVERYEGRTPTPEEILAEEPEEFRAACGFSRAKVASLRSLAEHVVDGRLELGRLEDLPDEQVIEELVAVKGIGVWTAQMFLMFTLHRPDVLPVGDLGVRNAAMRAYGLEKAPAPDELTALAEAWRPHRTRASLYLWRSLDNTPATE
jgi:DNA-3-methyladenine glycosylase II